MPSSDAIATAADGLRRVGADLSRLAGALQQQRPAQIDCDALANRVDGAVAVLLADPRRRASFARGMASRASRAQGLYERVLSGDTGHSMDAVVLELLGLRSALGIVAELLERDGGQRAA